jgi:hypothetical protein
MYRLSILEKIIKIDNDIIDQELLKLIEEETEKIKEEERKWKEKFNNMTIKIEFKGENKHIDTKKHYTLKEIKEQIKEAFKLEFDNKNMRLRVLNSNNRKLEGYSDEEKVLVNSYFIYRLWRN